MISLSQRDSYSSRGGGRGGEKRRDNVVRFLLCTDSVHAVMRLVILVSLSHPSLSLSLSLPSNSAKREDPLTYDNHGLHSVPV